MRALIRLAVAVVLLSSPIFCQQEYVTRYDVFGGYSFLNSPSVGLFENGFEFQIGVRPKTWYSLGFDYSISAGDLTITSNLLTPALQSQLSAQLQQLAAAGMLPPGFSLSVPTHSRTQTFAAGPQFSYRRLSHITLFVRPSVGAIYEVATPHPADPIASVIAAQLAPSGKKTDWTAFYGFGGGADFIFSKHLALRVQSDLVHDHLFSDLLQNGRWTTKFSVGPAFNFGKNIAK